ncbi:3-oxoacyl-ACP synthase [[Phormidium ambiguum] IAM M-71]|uniref:Beta-ketoacyl-[acyl-carrier-protein] synthase III n=1 Tax=[Phormidium ambiguum] IAM M-71 TaxID=454136 RepID=A0A1U7IEC0_9CYAN|nr:beta-ketoacyl-ACP synthase III [Phormidium ambiguum]OKH35225.1 3-oxoacyl-ACP synthase [Phormidium ambiguum IAM M-71]
MLQQFGKGVAITGSGAATPAVSLTNQDLSQIVDTSDEWISSRTGIQQRRLAMPGQSLCELASIAGENAIAMAGIAPEDIDLIILATSTADDLFGTASQIQGKIGATKAVAFDLTAACSGFVFALVTGAQFIRNGVYRNVLLIGGDVLSRWVDWSDRRTCILFGDGAGAVVMQAVESDVADSEVSDTANATLRDRLLGFEIRSDGTQNHYLNLSYKGEAKELIAGVSVEQGNFQPITMNGQEVYRFAVKRVPEVIEKALFRANLTVDQVDWLILHQANQRILDAVAQRLKIPPEKVISNLANYGNTSAASIPIALDEAVREGKIKVGDTIATAGFGAGLTWGAAIFQWGK